MEVVQFAATDQAEIRHVLFPFSGIRPPAFTARTEFERHAADVLSSGSAIPKTVVACPKNGAEYAMARYLFPLADKT
jgi:hypothetical protein